LPHFFTVAFMVLSAVSTLYIHCGIRIGMCQQCLYMRCLLGVPQKPVGSNNSCGVSVEPQLAAQAFSRMVKKLEVMMQGIMDARHEGQQVVATARDRSHS
jgi:hypothetical protein